MEDKKMLGDGRKLRFSRLIIFIIGSLIFQLSFPGITNADITLLHEFAGGNDGAEPWGDVVISGSTLYGMTFDGGSGSEGTIFKVDIDGSGYSVLHNFGPSEGSNGQRPFGSLTLDGTVLYGATYNGGTGITSPGSGYGVIFKINTDGSGYEHLHDCSTNAMYPVGALTLDGTTLYGMTNMNFSTWGGVIFEIETDGSNFNILHKFDGWDDPSEGCNPNGTLTLDGTTLYGMTSYGGNSDGGVVFKINTNGSDYTVLHHFTGGPNDGFFPLGSLTLDDTTLYGMTYEGGDNERGVIFKMSTDGNDFQLLHRFSGVNDATRPKGSLLLMGSTLYGMGSGDNFGAGEGAIFRIDNDGNNYQVLHAFEGYEDDGSTPYGSLINDGAVFYGMTSGGGDNFDGVVFAYDLCPPGGCADLIITDIWNDANTIWYQVMNVGDGDCTSGHTTTLYVDSNEVATDVVDVNLPASARLSRPFSLYTWQCSPLYDDISVMADSTNDIFEESENNNSRPETWKCDNYAPQITSGPIATDITDSSATISWSTDEDSNSVVRYSENAGKYDKQESNPTKVTFHEINLSGLKHSTTYQYLIESTDASDNTAISNGHYFETLAEPGGPEPNIVLFSTSGRTFPLEFTAEVFDFKVVERVEFDIDGLHIENDYSAPYRCNLNPNYTLLEPNDIIGVHTVAARAYNQSNSLVDTIEAEFTYRQDCPASRVNITEPEYGLLIFTDTNEAPSQEILLEVDASKYSGVICRGYMRDIHGEVGFEPDWVPVNQVEFLIDNEVKCTSLTGVDVNGLNHQCVYDPNGLSVGEHLFVARAETTSGCYRLDSVVIEVIKRRPDISVSRTVNRVGNYFEVELDIENIGLSTAYLDSLVDTLEGFQAAAIEDTTDCTGQVSYSNTSRICTVTVTFTPEAISIEPSEVYTFTYLAVPIMYADVYEYHIGASSGEVNYHGVGGPAEPEELRCPCTRVGTGPSSRSVADAVDEAFASSDYLIITSPQNLFGKHVDSEVNMLLAKAAELATLRNGVLGYYNPFTMSKITFDRSDFVATGNNFGDPLFDEIYLASDDENLIHCFTASDEFDGLAGELPISQSVHAGDGFAVGNVYAETLAGTEHPYEEILVAISEPSMMEGTVAWYEYHEATATFESHSFDTAYNAGDGFVVGDVLAESGLDEDEVLIANEDGVIQIYRAGSGDPIVEFDSVFAYGDFITTGNIMDDYRDEIIVGSTSSERLYIYDGLGSTLLTYDLGRDLNREDGFAVGDVSGADKEEIIIADESSDTTYIYRYNELWADIGNVSNFHMYYHPDDKLAAGDMVPAGKTEILFLRGSSEENHNRGDVEMVSYVIGESVGDRDALDDLLDEGGSWTESMHRDWASDGHLLIIGEIDIIPAFARYYTLIFTTESVRRIEYTDSDYANTTGMTHYPELAMGRIIGDTAGRMLKPIQASIDIARGDVILDNSHAYVASGHVAGPGGGSVSIDYPSERRDVKTKLENRGFSVAANATPSVNQLCDNSVDRDMIHICGHGSESNWDIITCSDIDNQFDPCSTRPVVYCHACRTGRYPAGYCFAEAMLNNGASIFIGATENSISPWSMGLAKFFHDKISDKRTIGQSFKEAKRRRAEGSDNFKKHTVHVYHLFGDPKLRFDGLASLSALPAPLTDEIITEATLSSNISVPDYTVTDENGFDYVKIPDGGLLEETDKPLVPTYSISLEYPTGVEIQNVVMTEKGDVNEVNGLNLPIVSPGIDGWIASMNQSSEGDIEWWPQDNFIWTRVAEPNDNSTLVITVYPFIYNVNTTHAKFYQSYNFDITYTTSAVSIRRLRTNKTVYEPNEIVDIELYFLNSSEEPNNVLVESVIRQEATDDIYGLPLRTLKSVQGISCCSMEWNSNGFASGNYSVEVKLMDIQGELLDSKIENFQLGKNLGRITDVNVVPECFAVSDDVDIAVTFQNIGDVNISGTLFVEVQSPDGNEIAKFQQDFNDVPPDSSIIQNVTWLSSTKARGYCRFVIYALYDGKSSETVVFPEIGNNARGDINDDGNVNFKDFAVLANYWLLNEPFVDIAPPGGDCMVDYLDLNILANYWLGTTSP